MERMLPPCLVGDHRASLAGAIVVPQPIVFSARTAASFAYSDEDEIGKASKSLRAKGKTASAVLHGELLESRLLERVPLVNTRAVRGDDGATTWNEGLAIVIVTRVFIAEEAL